MLKNRNILSSTRLPKKNTKPHHEVNTQPKISRVSLQINTIIHSLQKNVKDLKSYYRERDSCRTAAHSLPKNNTVFRLKKVLRRNGSQTNLTRPHSQTEKHSKHEDMLQSDSKDKNYCDIFEVRRYFTKMYGRQTSNIIELYQFYKKNLEKKDKSTRILASMDMSNPHMGLSLEVGKESTLRAEQFQQQRQSIKKSQKLPQQKIIADKLELSSKFESSSKLDQTGNTYKHTRPSNLANDLMSKGLYNIANVANLMINKKYKLTKEKEESFQRAKLHKEKINALKIDIPKENISRQANMQNQPQSKQKRIQEIEIKSSPMFLVKNSGGENLRSYQNSLSNKLDLNASFDQQSNKQQGSCESNLYQQRVDKSGYKDNIANVEEFQVSSIKKPEEDKIKLDEISGLQESPIVPQQQKCFQKSKYYVQPVPDKKIGEEQLEHSIILKSNSRIIDIDLLPFDL